MTEDFIVDAIVEIGNSPEVKRICEPSVSQPLTLQKWMVIRTLKSFELFRQELDNELRRIDTEKAQELLEGGLENEL